MKPPPCDKQTQIFTKILIYIDILFITVHHCKLCLLILFRERMPLP